MVKRTQPQRGASASPARPERRSRQGVSVQLMMECVEEDLSPVQRRTYNDLQNKYHQAMIKIAEANSLAKAGKAIITMHNDPRKPIPPPPVMIPQTAALQVAPVTATQSTRQPAQQQNKQVQMVPTQNTPNSAMKRPNEDQNLALAKKKRVETDDSGNWVPLDEYYYGKMEGDPTYSENKDEFRFKCWYCNKMLYNNIKAMMHIQGHIDSSKQQNIDLSDLCQCKHCYKQFDTPFEMQTHVEKVHMNNVNVLLCRICERDHESRQALTNHMRQNHNSCEMPYICHLCNFRSSMYSDVVDHFKKKHDSSQYMMCLYCLKTFNVKFVSQGWGQTQTYYGHLLKHQSKTSSKKCPLCRLTFFNPQDVKAHKKKDHLPNQKGIGSNARYSTPGQVMIKVPTSGLQPKIKSLNAPTVSKILDFGGTQLPLSVNNLHCFECKMSMGTVDHYKKHIECSMCRYATSCSFAYANHMMGFHSGQMSSLNLNIPWERPMPTTMYCLCGFGSRYGNKIANHLVYCTKRSCYTTKPDGKLEEPSCKVDERDPRHKPGASLLDVLGLVKKTTVTTRIRSRSTEEKGLIWKPPPSPDPQPEEEEEVEGDDTVPPELKGSRKWSTVRITDPLQPSKASVFLGGGDTQVRLIPHNPPRPQCSWVGETHRKEKALMTKTQAAHIMRIITGTNTTADMTVMIVNKGDTIIGIVNTIAIDMMVTGHMIGHMTGIIITADMTTGIIIIITDRTAGHHIMAIGITMTTEITVAIITMETVTTIEGQTEVTGEVEGVMADMGDNNGDTDN
ncbi:hypothetical protein FSP39_023825 [Pinctada imbricata]|uniref:C2H2-type domain-containing protein n=1 Tax=Pinctada imbricata TaxID=66713 RepID=A0AA88YG64_PINIB|nr:hypothetical protein FSP39_023825 [Pinctada imbricata]